MDGNESLWCMAHDEINGLTDEHHARGGHKTTRDTHSKEERLPPGQKKKRVVRVRAAVCSTGLRLSSRFSTAQKSDQ